MKCPICKTDVNTYSFHVRSCPNCSYDGSTFNALTDLNIKQ